MLKTDLIALYFFWFVFQGFASGQLLKKKQEVKASKSDVELVNMERSCNLKGSLSLPHTHVTE
jgi:hypothetical protein